MRLWWQSTRFPGLPVNVCDDVETSESQARLLPSTAEPGRRGHPSGLTQWPTCDGQWCPVP